MSSQQTSVVSLFSLFFQGDPLRTLPLSRGGSVESLPARTQCLASSDSKRMSADLSELEPKMPFAPAGNARHDTAQNNTWQQSRRGEELIKATWHALMFYFLLNKKSCTGKACSVIAKASLVGMRHFQVHKKLLPWHQSQVLFVLSHFEVNTHPYSPECRGPSDQAVNHPPSVKGSDRKHST